MEEKKIKHALRYSWLNRSYDTVTALTCREKLFKTRMIEFAASYMHEPVVDIACGTGTFMGMLKEKYPHLKVTGFDADKNILEIARQKNGKLEGIDYVNCYSQKMEFADNYAGLIFSSFLYHHLDSAGKKATTGEANRVLKPGCAYIIADWGHPSNFLTGIGFTFLRILDGFDTTLDNYHDCVPGIMRIAGFTEVAELNRINTVFGTVKIWRGLKP
jgi:ubiquinone/menaquinone biosynthesis C-methylase UbiE